MKIRYYDGIEDDRYDESRQRSIDESTEAEEAFHQQELLRQQSEEIHQ